MERMKGTIRLICAALAATLALSCEKDIMFVGQYDGEKIVMFAVAEPGHPLVVKLESSNFILNKEEDSMRGTISDGSVWGKAGDRDITFVKNDSIRGRYDSSYVPSEGETIEISASRKGYATVNASTTVPESPHFRIESCRAETPEDEDSWYRVHVKVTIDDPAGIRNFYSLRMYSVNTVDMGGGEMYTFTQRLFLMSDNVLFYDNTPGIDLIEDVIDGSSEVPDYFDDGIFDGTSYTFEVVFEEYPSMPSYLLWDYYYASGKEYSYQETELQSRSYVAELSAVSPEIYKYSLSVTDYNRYDNGIGYIFGEPVSIFNNVEGGIGCFGGMNTKTVEFDKN